MGEVRVGGGEERAGGGGEVKGKGGGEAGRAGNWGWRGREMGVAEMTRYKENGAAFLARLGAELAKRGYKWTKKDPHTFTRQYPGGRMDVLHVALVRHEDEDFDVVLDCGLRVDPAEELVGQVTRLDT